MKRSAAVTALAFLLLAPSASGAGDPGIAALQVGLRQHGLYRGPVDGTLGPGTIDAVRRLQRRKGLAVDGVPGLKTRRALGRFGRHDRLGGRTLVTGNRGWDVAALQFQLAWHGFPSGRFDGTFGTSTELALRRFQRWAGLGLDGVAGAGAFAALRRPMPRCPISLAPPLGGPIVEGFGPRGNRFHSGVDYPAAIGTQVGAAAAGRVSFAGWAAGGWGYLVMVKHSSGTRTMYAHLSRVAVRVGQWVEPGQRVGLVGASGRASGPHLHFEVRLRGAAVDPLGGLLSR
jgi:peptidoglycan hydrolase-like protein with peptidoglycan-binding domain